VYKKKIKPRLGPFELRERTLMGARAIESLTFRKKHDELRDFRFDEP